MAKADNDGYAFQVERGVGNRCGALMIDAFDETISNWMRFVNNVNCECARRRE
jgi:hypothetical protein